MIRLTGTWPEQVQNEATDYLMKNWEEFSEWSLEKIDSYIEQIYDTFCQWTTEDIQSLFDDDDKEDSRIELINLCVQLEAFQVVRDALTRFDREPELQPVGMRNARKNLRLLK